MSYNVIRHIHGMCGFPCKLFNTGYPSHSWSNFSCKMVTSVWQPGLSAQKNSNSPRNGFLVFAPFHSPVVFVYAGSSIKITPGPVSNHSQAHSANQKFTARGGKWRQYQPFSMLFSPIKAEDLQLNGSVPTPHFLLLHPSCWKAPCF